MKELNKLSLNMSKTELIIFHRNTASIDHKLHKSKLDEKRLNPSPSVKYLRVFLDKHIQWNNQIA